MSVIVVRCTDQVLKIVEAPVVASGGKNEVKVEFDFCEKWDGFAKTAVFYRDGEDPYYAILDNNDVCIVPWEVCYADGAFRFSVFGDKNDVRRTSTEVRYKVKKGAITAEMKPSDPTPDVYDQIMAAVAEIQKAQAVSVDPTLSVEGQAADAKAVGSRLKDIEANIADLHYEAIDITSCSVDPSVVEIGSTVQTATVTWEVSKAPVSQTVEDKDVGPDSILFKSFGMSLTDDKSYTVSVQDERDAVDTATVWIRFYNGVYYGTLAEGAVINSAAILSMTKSLQSGKAKTFTATGTSGRKFAYALPSRYGTPAFNVGGFDYVWTKAATFGFTNASGYTEQYDVWMNDEVVIGTRTIRVT